MAISFNEMPKNIRTPFVYVEFDNSKAMQGPALMPYTCLVIGQKTADGSQAPLVPVRVTQAVQARQLFGSGSMLDLTLSSQLATNDFTETWVVALDDDQAAVAASGTLQISGGNGIGTLNIYIGPFFETGTLRGRIRVGVTPAMTASDIATAIAGEVNFDVSLPVTAAATSDTVTFTAKNKGAVGNELAICANIFDGEETPQNITLTWGGALLTGSPSPSVCFAGCVAGTAAYYGNNDPARPFQTLPLSGLLAPQEYINGMRLMGGTGNPDVSDVWAVLDDTHYNIITSPYTDASNLYSIKEELKDRCGPLRMTEGMCFCASSGAHSDLGTLGDSHNSPDICIMGTGGPFTLEERNLLLFDGISTFQIGSDDSLCVERLITTYKETPFGAEDTSYLDVNTRLTLGYLRYDFRNYILRKYPRHKLADDGTNFGQGQAVMTPNIGKAEALARFKMWEEKGLVENIDQFKNDLICERNISDPNRLDWRLSPDLINQFRVGAAQIQFLL